jgi:heat shock protein HslJ
MVMQRSLTVILIVFLFATCSRKQHMSQAQPSGPAITETHWTLAELMGKPISAPAQGQKEMYMILRKENGRVEGNSGCNSFSNNYELKESNKITFKQMVSTKMAYIDMQDEIELLKVFDQADSY